MSQNLPRGSYVKLVDVCEFKYGKSLPETSRRGGSIPVFGSNGVVGHHNEALSSGPTIVIGRKGSFGEVHYSKGSCWPIDTTYYVDGSATSADLRWLTHCLGTLGLKDLNRAAAVPGLNREDAYRQSLLLPALSDQRRIADILDKADALRAKRRAALAQLDALTHSIFLDLFGDPVANPKKWPSQPLGTLLESQRYGPRFYNEAYSLEGTRIVRITDLDHRGTLDFGSMPRMDVSEADYQKYVLRPGDLLFARSGATVGKTALVRRDDPPCIAGAYFIVMRFNPEVNPEYALAVLNAASIQSLIAAQSRQSAQQNFSGPGLRRLPVPVPPESLQNAFVRRIAAIREARRGQESSLAGLDALFASLQHRAFRGEL